jgi:FkbM family methyltransferase
MRKSLLAFAAWIAGLLPGPFRTGLYRVPGLAPLLRRMLNRAAPQGLSEVRIAAGGLAGYTLQLDLQTEKDYWLGTYEPELEQAAGRLVPPGAVVYDVGANIGYTALLLAKAAGQGGRVYAFEALPDNLARLQRNVALNGMTDRIRVVPAAVTQATGPVRFLVHASGGMGKVEGSAGRTDETYPSELLVEGLSLDDFVFGQGNPPPQVIKMDIEGGEVLALPGMRRVLQEARPRLLMELHGPESARAAWEALGAAGYEISWMRPGFPAVPSLQALGWKAYIIARPQSAAPAGSAEAR